VTGSTVEVLRRIQETEPIRPRKLVPKLDSDVEAIVLTALAKKPEERYQSAADFRSDLENWLAGMPIRVKSANTMYLVRKIISKHRYTSAVVALLIVIILSFGYISLWLFLSAKRAKAEAQAITTQWDESVQDNSVFAKSIAFSYFLQVWHSERGQWAAWAAASLPPTTKEGRAAAFLRNPQPIAQKEAAFRQALSSEPLWFTEFIVGEQHRKDGNRTEALKAYQRSHAALALVSPEDMSRSDQWLSRNVAAMLYELTEDDQRRQDDGQAGGNPEAAE
jgi:hypothetical protein